jgi:hypothetical protein
MKSHHVGAVLLIPVLAARDKNPRREADDVATLVLNALYHLLPTYLTQLHPLWFPPARATKGPQGSGCEVAADPLHDPFGGVTVPVRIPGGGREAIGSFVGEQPRGVLDDGPRVRASQDRSAGGHALGAFRGVAHHQDRLAQ